MMGKLKIGIVGCGSIARERHIPEYLAGGEVEIVAVCDLVEARAQEVETKFNISVHTYTDYQEMLKQEPSIEAVSVCTPNYMHAPVSIAALEAGKHVLCEKPMATSSQEAQDMIEAAEKSGTKLMIAHNQRLVPSHVKARELLEEGALGKIYSFRTVFGHGGPEGWSIDGADSWFFRKEEAFIGAMGDLGVHKSDLIQFLFDEPVAEVGAFVETVAKENTTVDDNAVCVLKMESGIVGTLTASWSYKPFEDNATVIYGEKGMLRLEDDPQYSLIAVYTSGETMSYDLGGIQTNAGGGMENTGIVDAFVETVVKNTPIPITGADGKRALDVILAALESSMEKTITSVRKAGVTQ